jgi:hypothetical protein
MSTDLKTRIFPDLVGSLSCWGKSVYGRYPRVRVAFLLDGNASSVIVVVYRWAYSAMEDLELSLASQATSRKLVCADGVLLTVYGPVIICERMLDSQYNHSMYTPDARLAWDYPSPRSVSFLKTTICDLKQVGRLV